MIVAKVGGAVAAGAIPPLGQDVCVVHGGGPQITAEMERLGLPVRFVGGRRVTTPEALAVVRRALARVNHSLCAALGPHAVGFMGDELGLPARRLPGLGLVGEPLPWRAPALVAALADGLVPVVAPLAVDHLEGGPLNVNADDLAAALAAGLGAERLVFLTDVPGLLLDGDVVPAIQADEAEDLLASGTLEGGILPKLNAAVAAARLGVSASIGETAVLA